MKKIISMVLVFVMILSFMPIGALPAYAESEENSIQEIDQEVVNNTTPVENTNDQNSETNLGQTENQELGEQTPGQEISGELDNLDGNGDNQESELINSNPSQEPEQPEGGNGTQGDTEEPVFVYFALTPVDATVTVYTVDEENPEESQMVEPQDDPYLYLLQPGLYCYTVEAEGYYDIAKALLYVEPSDDTYIVERELERDESIVLEDESEAEVSAQAVSLMAGGQKMVTLSFASPVNLGAAQVKYEGGLPASITGPIGFTPSEPFAAPRYSSYYDYTAALFDGWSATLKKINIDVDYTGHIKTTLSDTSTLIFDEYIPYADSYRWKWGTSITSDTVLYALVYTIPESVKLVSQNNLA